MKTIHDLIEEVRSNPRIDRAGMILCHNGIVRGFSRGGEEVSKLKVKADRKALEKLIDETKKKPGIVDLKVHINEGVLGVGDDVMLVVVAGDVRENTFPVLIEVVDTIKRSILEKEDI
ncbi:MAG TPA: molybdenum cofactor biosynthesis protein MoaE [Methanocellales archaeon]|nr:molybdenum cofactor biosynthesis protein MoaE [Methanocellales archaeon]